METKEYIKTIANVCHEANRAFCQNIGDFSQPSWRNAPDWQKESIIHGVKLHLRNPHATPEESHKNWFREKQIGGWVYGEIKNAETKTHPCMKPYGELPWNLKIKDHIFKAIVNAMGGFLLEANLENEEK